MSYEYSLAMELTISRTISQQEIPCIWISYVWNIFITCFISSSNQESYS